VGFWCSKGGGIDVYYLVWRGYCPYKDYIDSGDTGNGSVVSTSLHFIRGVWLVWKTPLISCTWVCIRLFYVAGRGRLDHSTVQYHQ
jgi:hypothetical protein